jgi:CHAT domain-containing protein
VEALASGLRLYRQALEAEGRGQGSEAEATFRSAEASLAPTGSPVAAWAAYQVGVRLYHRDRTLADATFAALAGRYGREPFPTLLGQVAWMRGLCAMAAGRPAAALGFYRAALELFSTSRDERISHVQVLLAEALRRLGQGGEAWRHRLAALHALAAAGDRRGRHNALHDAINAALDAERPELALALQEELLANDAKLDSEGERARPASLLRRGEILALLERSEEAAADLDAARALIEALPPAGERRRLETTLLLQRGELLAATDPVAAETVLSAALGEARGAGHLSQLPRLLLARARARLARGDLDPAEADLAEAVATLALRRREPSAEEFRIGYFESAQKAYDAMVRFQAEERGDALRAFDYAEQARAQALLDRLAAAGLAVQDGGPAEAGRAPSAGDVLAALPAGITLVEYAALPEELFIWTFGNGREDLIRRPLALAELCRRVEALRAAVDADLAAPEILAPASSLFDELMRPVLGRLAAGETLVLVPDRCLSRLPFAVLRDRLEERFLVERHPLIVAPSAAFALAAQRRAAESPGADGGRVLAVGNPAFDGDRFPRLSDLPQSADEAVQVAALYPQAEVLLGQEATRGRVEAALPAAGVLHLAAHALPEAGRTEPAVLALAADPGDPLRGAPSSRELHRADLQSVRLVFLSACGTVDAVRAGGSGSAGREGVAGLARAFLAAGVPATVATLRRVDDRAAHELALAFHRRHAAGVPPAEALRAAQLELLSRSDPALSSPSAWGVFQLYGGPAPTAAAGPGR